METLAPRSRQMPTCGATPPPPLPLSPLSPLHSPHDILTSVEKVNTVLRWEMMLQMLWASFFFWSVCCKTVQRRACGLSLCLCVCTCGSFYFCSCEKKRLGFCAEERRGVRIKTKKATGSRKGGLIGYQILSGVETEVSTNGEAGEI